MGRPAGRERPNAGLARAAGVVNCVNFNQRFYPQAQEMAARVRDGSVGDLRLVSGSYLQDWLLEATDWNWRLDDAVGGPLRAGRHQEGERDQAGERCRKPQHEGPIGPGRGGFFSAEITGRSGTVREG